MISVLFPIKKIVPIIETIFCFCRNIFLKKGLPLSSLLTYRRIFTFRRIDGRLLLRGVCVEIAGVTGVVTTVVVTEDEVVGRAAGVEEVPPLTADWIADRSGREAGSRARFQIITHPSPFSFAYFTFSWSPRSPL